MTTTYIGLFRHGQTDWNIDFRLQGTSDIPMNETGLEQVKTATRALASDWEVAITSPLGRAVQTAQIATEYLGLDTALVEPLLLERSFGDAEGMLYEDWRELLAQAAVPGCESIAELETRCHRLLESIVRAHEGKRVLAVSHGALIRKVLNLVSKNEFPREGERLGNASLSVIAFDGSHWRIEDYRPHTLA